MLADSSPFMMAGRWARFCELPQPYERYMQIERMRNFRPTAVLGFSPGHRCRNNSQYNKQDHDSEAC